MSPRRKRMSRVGALVLVSGLLLLAMVVPLEAQLDLDTPPLGPLSTSEIYQRVSDSVVRICPDSNVVGVGCGSGVIIDVKGDKGTIATNAHVMDGADAAHIVLSNGKTHSVEGALAMHAAIDIMLITITAPDLKAASLSDFGPLAIGQEVVVVSSPSGYLNTVSESIVAGCRTYASVNSGFEFVTDRYQIDGGTSPGSSGGGVFDRAGALVGLAVEGVPDTPELDFVVPSPFVKWLYDNQSDRPISVPQARRLQDLYKAALQIMRTLNAMGNAASSQAESAELALRAVELNFRDPEFDRILNHEIDLLRRVAALSTSARDLQGDALNSWVPQLVQPGAICAGLSQGPAQE